MVSVEVYTWNNTYCKVYINPKMLKMQSLDQFYLQITIITINCFSIHYHPVSPFFNCQFIRECSVAT